MSVNNNINRKRSKTGLMPCPFCGSTNLFRILYKNQEKGDLVFIQCDDCHTCGPSCSNEEEARMRWDTRAVII